MDKDHSTLKIEDEVKRLRARVKELETIVAETVDRDIWETVRQQKGMTFKFIKKNGRFIHTFCAGEMLSRFGLVPEQVVGKQLIEFLPLELAVRKMKYYQRAWDGEEITYEGEDGDFTYIASLRPVKKDGMVVQVIASCIEITESKQREKTFQKSLQDHFQKTVQNLQNLVFIFKKSDDNSFVYTLFEGKLAQELGLTTNKVFGKTAREIFPRDVANVLEEYQQRAMSGEVVHYEIKMDNRYFNNTLSPIMEEGEVVEVVGSSIDITGRLKAEEENKYLAYYDTLTDLPNRIMFNKHLNVYLNEAKHTRRMMAVILLDIDRFKNINDSLGHSIGDQLLQGVAERLKRCLSKDELVARMSGDEFILLLPHVDNQNQVIKKIHKIIKSFKQPLMFDDHEFYITISLGISQFPADGEEIDSLVKNAETAMYRAKEQGRNNYQLYSPAMNERAFEKLALENSLRKSLKRKEFFLHYQPRINLDTGQFISMEALIRWKHPDLGLVSPAEFIPLAEETGLIIPIGEWVLRTACAQNKEWQEAGLPPMRVAVNISARQFHLDNLIKTISNVLKETGLEPEFLELEITENSIMQDTELTVSLLHEIKEMGVKLSIDDFGTGYSSLGYLKSFPIDTLKIDKSFVRDITTNPDDAAIATSIITLAHSLNFNVIAEGVETVEQFSFLKEQLCDQIQGFYFCRPLPAEEFARVIIEAQEKSPLLRNT
jgi:diguanylate cyclase (GGDEF)-like protein/PAS domain S-box-containing protein